MKNSIIKFLRFTSIYGINRALNKSLGRLRIPFFKAIYFRFFKKKYVSIIGCGQFAFSTITFFLKKNQGNVFLGCYDILPANALSLANYYSFKTVYQSHLDLLKDPNLKIVYVASNHNSHTQYAIDAMKADKIVYIEKPLSTTYKQFVELISNQKFLNSKVFAGYNRPYSKAIADLRKYVSLQKYEEKKAFSLNFFISGHLIPSQHWYRKPEEGTRVCGNLGHWIDLTIHIFGWRKIEVKNININITYSSLEDSDDNLNICFSTNLGDIVSITLSSRTEPFEGINETLNFQYGDIISKVDDFRKLTIWDRHKRIRKNYFPKDVGHQRAILQPFYHENRNWKEVELSTLLMLKVKEMVLNAQSRSIFNIFNEYGIFQIDIEKELNQINETNYTKP
jgi:predicted dehydrogenase